MPAVSAEDTVRGSDVVGTVTTAAKPLFDAEWLEPGTHLNAAGSNALIRQELSEAAVRRCNVIAVDSVPTALAEAGDLLPLLEKGRLHERQLLELGDVIIGRRLGRESVGDITLFGFAGELRLPPAGVGGPSTGEPVPQFVVGGTVHAGERLPLVEQHPEPVDPAAPVVALRQRLGLDDHGLLRGDGRGVLFGAGSLAGLDLRGKLLAQRVEAPGQRLEVADGVGLGDVRLGGGDGRLGLFRRHRLRADARLEEGHLRREVLEAPDVERHGLFGGGIGDLPDTSFGATRDDVDRAVRINTSEVGGRLCFAHGLNLAG